MKTSHETQARPEHRDIADLAKQIWEREGRQAGRDMEYWLQAEQELLSARVRENNPPQRPVAAAHGFSQGKSRALRKAFPSTRAVRR